MAGLILAAVTPDNTPHGYNWTFAFPMLLFIIVGTTLYLLFSRPHRRIPARRGLAPVPAVPPDPDSARAAAVAGGLPTAAGGGAAESHLEPAGPPAGPAAAAGAGAGSVSERASSPQDAGQQDPAPPAADSTEASE